MTATTQTQLPEELVARHPACAAFAGRALDAALIAALEAEIARRQASVRGLRFLRQVEIDMDDDACAAIVALRTCSLCAHCAVPPVLCFGRHPAMVSASSAHGVS